MTIVTPNNYVSNTVSSSAFTDAIAETQATHQTGNTVTPIDESGRWYHYGWLWFVIALPATVVIAAMITVAIAFQNAPQLLPSATQASAPVHSDAIKNTRYS